MLESVAQEIVELIDEIGRTVQVRTITNSGTSYDPAQTPRDKDARAAIVGYNAYESVSSIIQADDKKGFIAATSTVTKQDKIIDGGLEYTIVNLHVVGPGDEKILHIAQLRA